MKPSTNLAIGMAAAVSIVVTPDMTVGHFVPGMPQVYATPMMILHMEMAAGLAIAAALPSDYVSVGMSVDIRHLAATPIGGRVRALACVKSVDAKSVLFEIEAWNDLRKIGAGTHRRGIVNVPEFEKRSGVQQAVA
ncbi:MULTISPECIES: hotdog domain-containing protein [unclassified Bradyrhizobium]|uniref:thioesterase family protein n=1 Tax=unclassified Bradyrhizobium TaxID=2631580 RepID=UPI003397E2DB